VKDTTRTSPEERLGAPGAGRRNPLAREFGWRRVLLIRRVAALTMLLIAAVLALRDGHTEHGSRPVVVPTRDLAPGAVLHAADVAERAWPPDLVPAGALKKPTQVEGRVLAGAAAAGEVLTSARLVGPELAMRATGRGDTAGVPIRLADADVAGLLTPGRAVDVVTAGPRSDEPAVVAPAAVVLAVLPPDQRVPGRGRVVVVAVPRPVASRLAAATLSQDVAVTLR
jgi:Flp pilus assembly protein CpaB